MIEESLLDHLTELGLTAYYMNVPSTAVLPFALITDSGFDESYHVGGKSNIETIFLEISCHAETPLEAINVGNTVINSINNFSGAMEGTEISLIRLTNKQSETEKDLGSYFRSLDFTINYYKR